MISLEILHEGIKASLEYLPVTMFMAFFSAICGLAFGLIIATCRFFNRNMIGKIIQIITALGRSVPLVLHLFLVNSLINTVLPRQIARNISSVEIAIIAFSINAIFNSYEVFIGVYESIEKNQFEACYSFGLTFFQSLHYVILPQLIGNAVPMMGNVIISSVKGTSLSSMVHVTDILLGALIVTTVSYSYLEAYIAASLIYWIIAISVQMLVKLYENNRKVRMGL